MTEDSHKLVYQWLHSVIGFNIDWIQQGSRRTFFRKDLQEVSDPKNYPLEVITSWSHLFFNSVDILFLVPCHGFHSLHAHPQKLLISPKRDQVCGSTASIKCCGAWLYLISPLSGLRLTHKEGFSTVLWSVAKYRETLPFSLIKSADIHLDQVRANYIFLTLGLKKSFFKKEF